MSADAQGRAQSAAQAEKQALREQMRYKRLSMAADARRQAEERMLQHLAGAPFYAHLHTVLCYASAGGEAGTEQLIARLRQDGKRVCLPHIGGGGAPRMKALEIMADTRFAPGAWGIAEPELRAERVVAPQEIDTIVFPGLAFDANGRRLGYGKGYFDEFAALLSPSCRRIGWCYGVQMVDKIPVEGHDVGMQYVVHEGGLLDMEEK